MTQLFDKLILNSSFYHRLKQIIIFLKDLNLRSRSLILTKISNLEYM